MDRDLSEAAKFGVADMFYNTITKEEYLGTKEYIQERINIMSDYFTENQRTNLRKLGFNVREY